MAVCSNADAGRGVREAAERAELALATLAEAIDLAGGGGAASLITRLLKVGGLDGRFLLRMGKWGEAKGARLLQLAGVASEAAEQAGTPAEDVHAILEALIRAARGAVSDKWTLLEHAARNAFDPKSFDASVTLDLLDRLQRIGPVEIALLSKLRQDQAFHIGRGAATRGSVELHLYSKLQAEGLIYAANRAPHEAGAIGPASCLRPRHVLSS